jgi:PPE-repeat protein
MPGASTIPGERQMHFAVLPPEVNSGRIYAGPGAGPMLAAATAWDELANELHTTAADLESVISGLTSEPWQGPSSASMAAAAAPQVAWLSTTAARANQTSAQVKAAAVAYESAYAMTVHPSVIAANRAQLMSLIATNLLGQNTAAIAATEVAYAEMWAQDVAAMYGYAGASQVASKVTPFTPPQQTTNQGGLTAQSATAAQAAGTAAGHAQTAVSSSNAMSAVPNALQTLTSSSVGLAAFADFANPYDLASLGSGLLGNGVGLFGLSGAAGFISDAEHKIAGTEVGLKASPAGASASVSRPAETVSAQMGRAASLGSMSVPEGWATAAPEGSANAAPEIRLAALESAGASSAANRPGPGLISQMPLFGGAPLTGLSGRGTSDSRGQRPGDERNAPGRQARAGAAPYDRVEKPREVSGGRGTGVAAELREITEVLSKLAQLRDNGALTDNEFIEQKQRLLGGH